ncbi:hypothetical protein [Methanofollis sp. UBA420]|jgi:hypothetical protein|uniref:hypothetical protein n=1 Tax=Methanofollis sp. UBA420 TaxID=1915514 RepID=UPI00316AE9D3
MGRAERYLEAYIERVGPRLAGLDETTGHAIASALLSFKVGLYGIAVTRADTALQRLAKREAPAAVATALEILKKRASDLQAQVAVSEGMPAFSGDDRPLLAMDLPADQVEDAVSYTLDNALLLLYAAGLISSPDDEQALDEHRGFPIQILASYAKQLNL